MSINIPLLFLRILLLDPEKQDKSLAIFAKSSRKRTFRYPQPASNDRLISAKIFVTIFRNLLGKRRDIVFDHSGDRSLTIFDENDNAREFRQEYLEYFGTQRAGYIISREDLLLYPFFGLRLLALFLSLLLFIPVCLLSIFSSNKLHLPLLFFEMIETLFLLEAVKRTGCKTLIFFCIFERAANIQAKILSDAGIFVRKVASEVPLAFHNERVVADELILGLAYQKEEMRKFASTMLVKRVATWGPESAPVTEKLLKSAHNESKADLGFYSSGNWLRAMNGVIDVKRHEAENEKKLLAWLCQFAERNNMTVKIFLHPAEKKTQVRGYVDDYYSGFMDKAGLISIAPVQQPSPGAFRSVDCGIGLYSTILFERIYFGFKTVIVPLDYPEFPLAESSMCNVAITDFEKLEALLLKQKSLSPEIFFEMNGVSAYVGASQKQNTH